MEIHVIIMIIVIIRIKGIVIINKSKIIFKVIRKIEHGEVGPGVIEYGVDDPQS